MFFDAGGVEGAQAQGADEEETEDADDMMDGVEERSAGVPASSATGGPPGPSAPKSLDDLTNDMFEQAEKVDPNASNPEREKQKKQVFSGKGFALGKSAGEDEGAEGPQASAPQPVPGKPQSKTYKVTVWQGNAFQVDDGTVRYPNDPVNKKFMEDLAKGWIPEELRERDGFGQPIPVQINLSDHREEDPSNAVVQKPKFKAFQGGGQTLGTDWTSEAYSKVASAAGSGAAGGSGAAAAGSAPQVNGQELAKLKPDQSKPVTSLQVRLPGGSRVQAQLNSSVTVATLRRWIVASGHMGEGQGFDIISGFPPEPLTSDTATLSEAGLENSAITIRPK